MSYGENGQNQRTDSVVEAVRQDLLLRSQLGIAKYGMTLERTDLKLREWLQHAYEETLDQANYLKRSILELDGISFKEIEGVIYQVVAPKDAASMTVEQCETIGKQCRDYGNPLVRAFAAERIGESYPLSEEQTKIALSHLSDADLGRAMGEWMDQQEKK